jgi:peptidoglycan/xylan/chitin deacetylase (PgdA/CDA1 family)
MSGRLIISLDFELHWGVFDHCLQEEPYIKNIRGAREVVPKLLKLFKKYNIHATWATVGMLFSENRSELDQYLPVYKPSYKNKKLNAYNVELGVDEEDDPLHYGMSLINKINSCEGQEIATHTFSHYYSLEEGQNKKQFAADIQAAIKIAEDKGIEISSIVFPRNQYRTDYFPILNENGVTVFRGNQPFFCYDSQKASSYNRIQHKAMRYVDSYMPVKGSHVYEPKKEKGLLNSKASFFFRPYQEKLSFLNQLHLKRIKESLTKAAEQGGDVHIWWHPHNFGVNQEKNLSMLESLLKHFSHLRDQRGMESVNMGALC